MLQAENDCGTERKTKRRIKAAKFALRPSFEDFDFAAKPLAHWTEVIADAIRHRLEHAALIINSAGESYRGSKARKPAAKNNEA